MDNIVENLQEAGKLLINKGLTFGNAGNISARKNKDRYLITASGTQLDDLKDDDFAEYDILDKQPVSSHKKPSKEVPMHLAIYEERPDVHAVLHGAPFYSTLMACSELKIPSNLFVESMYYLERIERVEYHNPGSEELGEAVKEKARSTNIILLNNHGVLVYDSSVKEALIAMQTLEMVCKMVITSKGAGMDLKGLPTPLVHDFLFQSGYKPKRVWED